MSNHNRTAYVIAAIAVAVVLLVGLTFCGGILAAFVGVGS